MLEGGAEEILLDEANSDSDETLVCETEENEYKIRCDISPKVLREAKKDLSEMMGRKNFDFCRKLYCEPLN